MKKIITVFLALAMFSSVAFALQPGALPYGVSAKYAAMGGAGSAMVDDITSAYYNPAGIVKAQKVSLKIGAGTALDGLDKLTTALGGLNNPSKYFIDNLSNDVNINGGINAFIGFTVAKVGISLLPIAHLQINKAATDTTGNVYGSGNFEGALTFGYGVAVPVLGSMNIGANLKYLNKIDAAGNVAIGGVTNTIDTYTGTAFDLGVQANIDAIPMMPLKGALVIKDIAANLSGNEEKTVTLTGGTPATTTTALGNITNPSTITIGVAGNIPVVGVKVAIDLDNVSGGTAAVSYSVTHIGLEYPVAMGLVNLRAGTISGGPSGSPINMTTYGAGILGNMINIAMISDTNNSKNNQTMFDVGFGF